MRNSCFIRILDNGKVLIRDNDSCTSEVIVDVESALPKIDELLKSKTQIQGDLDE